MSEETIDFLAMLETFGTNVLKDVLKDPSMFDGFLDLIDTVEELREEVGV